jgi:Fe2+ or Zn2+ uptake regulation protein
MVVKRGRPSFRSIVQPAILATLKASRIPLTISAIRRELMKQLKGGTSWNTVYKYVDQLVKVGKVEAVSLLHSKIKGKSGLTLYRLRR